VTGDQISPAAASVTDSGDAKADRAGVANTGIIEGDVRSEFHEHHHYPPVAVTWPVQVGRPPAVASAFQPRLAVRDRILDARAHGVDVVLTQHEARPTRWGTRVLAGEGGVGKSQLAAWLARQARDEQSAGLVMWVTASSPEQIITAYARAALRVGAPGADGADPEADAAAFCEWLHTTDRTWLIVLDDIVDPNHVAGWWPPHRPRGWTLATTRRRDAALASGGRRSVDVGVYSPDESAAYLAGRLADAGQRGLLDVGAGALAAALGHLPLALSHATAYMIDQAVGCTDYLTRYTTAARMAEVMPADSDPDGYGRPVTVTLLLALDAADTATPTGLARPALALAAMLNPDGHPDTLWKTAAVTGYLTEHAGRTITAEQSRAVLRVLHRYGLLTHTPDDGPRAVRIHALTARAGREADTADPALVARAAADALLQLWPQRDHATTDLVDALRTNTTNLAGLAGDLLWHPDGHPLLYRAGAGLLRSGLHTLAVGYWSGMVDDSLRVLGDDHPDTLTARSNLASSYTQAGRPADAITILEKLVGDRVRAHGDEHPETLTAWANVACSYTEAGRTDEAIAILKRVVAARVRLLGAEHMSTIAAQGNLAVSYRRAGRAVDAITIEEKVVAGRVRLLGDEHPDTLTARANLASSYRQAGRADEAITILEKVVDDSVRVLGEEHPDTLTAQGNLASSYWQADRTNDAITIEQKVVADRVRLLGDEHPSTLIARANLASSYLQAGKTDNAITILEEVIDHSVRVLGNGHPSTLTAQANLASSYRQAGRADEAITILEKVADDRVQVLGEEHPDTTAAVDALRAWRDEA
jgi:tetratricopeptide (TPR) repeat protein